MPFMEAVHRAELARITQVNFNGVDMPGCMVIFYVEEKWVARSSYLGPEANNLKLLKRRLNHIGNLGYIFANRQIDTLCLSKGRTDAIPKSILSSFL